MRKTKLHLTKECVFGIIGVLFCALFCVLPAPQGLAKAAYDAGSTGEISMRILGITVLSIMWWVGEVVPDWLTAIAMLLLWIVLGEIPFSTAFASFSGTSVWLIVGAFCLAAGITKTGLFKRISWFLIRFFSPTFGGQVLAMLVVGAICAPLVPSSTAKAVLGASIANNISDAMKYPKNSRGRCGLFIASFIGFSASTPAFMSGSVFTYTMLGALPNDIREGITWGSWLITMLPWLLILLICSFFAIRFFSAPREVSALTTEYVQKKCKEMGKLSKKEMLSALLLSGAVLLWILESILEIDAGVTAMAAAFLCFALHILNKDELPSAVPWGLVIFLGGVLNLGTILSRVGLDIWIQGLLSPLFQNIKNPILIITIVSVTVLVLRLVMVSQSATVIVMIAILSPVLGTTGFSPFLVGLIVLAAEQCWFLSFQNVVFTPALSCMQGSLEHGKTVVYCVIFEVISLIGFLISFPYWKILSII